MVIRILIIIFLVLEINFANNILYWIRCFCCVYFLWFSNRAILLLLDIVLGNDKNNTSGVIYYFKNKQSRIFWHLENLWFILLQNMYVCIHLAIIMVTSYMKFMHYHLSYVPCCKTPRMLVSKPCTIHHLQLRENWSTGMGQWCTPTGSQMDKATVLSIGSTQININTAT